MLDLTRLLPGPVCTLYLADLGADVVKVEDTGAGDYCAQSRHRPGTVSAVYRAVNRNKRSLALDLKDARGRDAFLALAQRADVIVESFRPGVVAALGVDYERSRRSIPASSMRRSAATARTARARTSPDTTSTTWAMPECSTRPARATDRPRFATCRSPICWAARPRRRSRSSPRSSEPQRTGRGRYVDVAMTDASLAHNIFALHALEQWGHVAPRGADLLTGGVPCYGVYPTRDGRWLAVGALEEKFWQALCAAIERPDLVAGQFALGDEGLRVRGELERIFAGGDARRVDREARGRRLLRDAGRDARRGDGRPAIRRRARWCERASDGSREYAPPFKVSGHEFTVTRQAPDARRAWRRDPARGGLRRGGDRRAHRRGRRQDFLTGLPPASRRAAPDGQRRDARVFGIVEAAAGGDIVGGHRGRVGAPEELVADRERGHAEDAAGDRLVGVSPQLVLHFRGRDPRVGIGHAERSPRAPPIRSADRAAGRRARRSGRSDARRRPSSRRRSRGEGAAAD